MNPIQAHTTATSTHYDVLVIGAGLAGVSTALLIKRRHPSARVLLVDKRAQLAKGGTSEPLAGVSSVFMSMALHATEILAREHLPRHGEHFWFAKTPHGTLAEMSELGADEFASHPAHHVDSRRLAHSLLGNALHEGVELLLGHEVTKVSMSWPQSSLTLQGPETALELQGRWVIDSSGRSAVLAAELDLESHLDLPPTWNAVANWTGVAPFDVQPEGEAPRRPFPRSREFATHHFHGREWRVSLVPHVGGGASLHLNLDWKAYAGFRARRSPLEAYSHFVRSCPGLRELLRDAQLEASSFCSHKEQDWTAKRRAARGWFLVGKAAGAPPTIFGERLDALVRTIWNAAEVVSLDLKGAQAEAELVERIGRYNLREQQYDMADRISLRSGTRALCGDAALCSVAYSLRRSVQSLEMRRIASDLERLSILSWHTLWQGKVRGAAYARLKELSRKRIASGHYGNRNEHWQLYLGPGESTLRPLGAALWQWLQLEYTVLRESMSPVPGDTLESSSSLFRRRMAEFHASTRATSRVPGSHPLPPSSIE
ncbi:MAG: 2-polyprenyl-6-methoxyphenol hydroxylase-like FAD-dependent oxidoreductase [Candidatus Paceibacteria bacterium]|jgi:2-polyprenyl-6-methoxyphenol hydroxylase-like FAD-dependent oxidoreductase